MTSIKLGLVRIDRILVIGCSGSGKSRLAARLAERLGLPYVATDGVYWTADWRPAPVEAVRAWIENAAAQDRWVMDGNFDAERDLVWGRAQRIVWLDLGLPTVLWQVTMRNFGWWIARKPVWGGGAMTLSKAVAGIGHSLRSHPLKRATFPAALAGFPDGGAVRLASAREIEAWLGRLTDSLAAEGQARIAEAGRPA